MPRPDKAPTDEELIQVISGSTKRDYSEYRYPNWDYETHGHFSDRFSHDFELHNKAFKEIRSLGIMARQNFKFTSSEGGYYFWEKCQERRDNGKPLPVGCVWYNTQNDRENGDPIFLNFDSGAVDDDDELDFNRLDVGILVCQVLKEHGIVYEWNGSEQKSIVIHPDDHQSEAYKERKFKVLSDEVEQARIKVFSLECQLDRAKTVLERASSRLEKEVA